ncbi:class I SAM-dependent methyltransferase [Halomarina salina]|uniref:Class I SAM-dependent methyltransferase n=1 Tax=Halomarina salina TaxID=1872699 RepID=A0ABD5RTU0_9EURY|nr:class I SAM-dependent methyltransferase [Halomarina salina]
MNESDRAVLAEQYADGANLSARIHLHETYEVADRDWWPWVFDHYDPVPADADLFEVGCGTAKLWQDNADRIPDDWRLLVTDFSEGMAADARESLLDAGLEATVGVAPAESLPYADESVDTVVANHMLYHTDRDVALSEMHRVLRPGGRLFATTNGEANMRELRALLMATTDHEPSDKGAFTLENGGEQLSHHFDTVHRYERDTFLRVPELEPLVAYAASLQKVDGQQVADFADRTDDHLDDGPLEIQKSMGLFVGQKA